MPIDLPYIVYGTVTDASSSVISGAVVVIYNVTQVSSTPYTMTDSQGKYVLDLANSGSYSSGDTIRVFVRDGKYVGETSFTLSGEGGRETNLTVYSISSSTIRDNAWLILYNHLQTGEFAISTNNIYSAMNKTLLSDKGYPMVIISPPRITDEKRSLNRDGDSDITLDFNLMIYHTSAATVKILADEVTYNLRNGWRKLAGAGLKNLQFIGEDYDWFNESENSTIHVYSIPLRFKW